VDEIIFFIVWLTIYKPIIACTTMKVEKAKKHTLFGPTI
jgi:hypothetical protein